MKNKLSFSQPNQPRKISRKKILWVVVGLIILVALLGYGVYSYMGQENDPKPSSPSSKNKKNNEKKEDSQKSQKDSTSTSPGLPENSATQTPQSIPQSASTSVDINDFSQANGKVQAGAVISGTTAHGTCIFTFTTDGSKPVVRQVTSTGSDGPQSCSVSIPEVEFSKLGHWNLNVTFYTNNTRSEANRDVIIT